MWCEWNYVKKLRWQSRIEVLSNSRSAGPTHHQSSGNNPGPVLVWPGWAVWPVCGDQVSRVGDQGPGPVSACPVQCSVTSISVNNSILSEWVSSLLPVEDNFTCSWLVGHLCNIVTVCCEIIKFPITYWQVLLSLSFTRLCQVLCYEVSAAVQLVNILSN